MYLNLTSKKIWRWGQNLEDLCSKILFIMRSLGNISWKRTVPFKGLTPNRWAIRPSLTPSKWNRDEICGLKFHLSYVDMPQELFWKFLHAHTMSFLRLSKALLSLLHFTFTSMRTFLSKRIYTVCKPFSEICSYPSCQIGSDRIR